jgi:hypothetical protein
MLSMLHHHRQSRSQYCFEQFHMLKQDRLATQDAQRYSDLSRDMLAIKAEHQHLAAIGERIKSHRQEIKAAFKLARTPSQVSAVTLNGWSNRHRSDPPKQFASANSSPVLSDDDMQPPLQPTASQWTGPPTHLGPVSTAIPAAAAVHSPQHPFIMNDQVTSNGHATNVQTAPYLPCIGNNG